MTNTLFARAQHLPLEDRRVIELAFQHNLSQREIGERLGVQAGTVCRRLQRAMRQLREWHDPRSLRQGAD